MLNQTGNHFILNKVFQQILKFVKVRTTFEKNEIKN